MPDFDEFDPINVTPSYVYWKMCWSINVDVAENTSKVF